MSQVVRKVANIYEDTRELLDQVKKEFEFGSDEQAIKFMCRHMLADDRYNLIRDYLESKRKAGES